MPLDNETRIEVYKEAWADARKYGDYKGQEFIERQLMRLGVLTPTPTAVKEKRP
jgi:hypothetical protein